MKLVDLVKKNSWTLAAMVLGPAVLQMIFLSSPAKTGDLPDWAYLWMQCGIPTSSAILSLLVACGLVLAIGRWKQITPASAVCFSVCWIFVFGYLNLFSFLMGMDLPKTPTGNELAQKFSTNLLSSAPFAAFVSIAVCVVATACLMMLLRALPFPVSQDKGDDSS